MKLIKKIMAWRRNPPEKLKTIPAIESNYISTNDSILEIVIFAFYVYDKNTKKYILENVGANYKRFKDLLIVLYNEVLCEDADWHFLLEGYYNILRFSSKFLPRVKKILDENGVVYQKDSDNSIYVKIWAEDQEITRQYQPHLKRLFHEYSLMAISIEDYSTVKLHLLAEKIIRCFFNNQLLNFQAELDSNPNFEGVLMGALATSSAFKAGVQAAYIGAYAKSREEIEQEYKNKFLEMQSRLEDIEKASDVNSTQLETLKDKMAELGVSVEKRRTIQ